MSTSQQEKFLLRWNDYENNLSEAFKELRDESEFLDVTLLCDSEDQIEAHRVVLSACSGFFRSVLRRTKHQHPLVYLKGVQHSDLRHILDFIYQGEVSIAQENLNTFLAVAENLKIKGLTQNNHNQQQDKTKSAADQVRVGSSSSQREISQVEELVQVKHEDSQAPVSHEEGSEMFEDDVQYDGSNQYQEIYNNQIGFNEGAGNEGMFVTFVNFLHQYFLPELDTLISTAMYKDQVTKEWRCNFCSKSHKDKARIKRHVEIHFPGFTQSCPYCCKELPSRNSLRVHISDAHTNVNKNQY